MIKYASLGSGSRGNATLVNAAGKQVLIDCGFTIKETQRRLQLLGSDAEQLDAILVTHEHGDHIKGVAPLARKFNIPVYMTPGTWHSKDLGQLADLRLIENYQPFQLGDLRVVPVAVPHDAREPAQFIIELGSKRLGILTDLGNISLHVEQQFGHCDALVLEANHDSMMLAMGPYPLSLKDRVGGPWGHLNNQQALRFLQDSDLDRLQQLVIAHVSEKNNCMEKVKQVFEPMAECVQELVYANQSEGFAWMQLS